MDLDTAVAELYGTAPGDFIATRARLAQENPALAERLRTLRRPTLSAWAVNLLARAAAEEVGWLLDAGADLRAAWESGDHIGGLEQRRSELIGLLVRTARTLAADAGHPLRDPAIREIEETLQAATIDPSVAADIRAGRLTQPRSHAGFGPLGRPGVAVPYSAHSASPSSAAPSSAGLKSTRRAGQQHTDVDRLEAESQAAATQAVEAARGLAEVDERAQVVRQELDAIEGEVERLAHELDAVKELRADADRRLRQTLRERDRVARTAETSRRRAEQARDRLTEARREQT